ncbi:hypothetical protein T484DRAFT_1840235, partial [Baffinella frigidus]
VGALRVTRSVGKTHAEVPDLEMRCDSKLVLLSQRRQPSEQLRRASASDGRELLLGTLAAVEESALDRAAAVCILWGRCPAFSPAQSTHAGRAFARFSGILGEFDATTERTDKVRSFLDLIALVDEEPSAASLAGRALASGGARARRLLCADVLAASDGEDAQHALLAAAVEILDEAPRVSWARSGGSPPQSERRRGEAPVGHEELAPRLQRVAQPHDSMLLTMERASWRDARLLDSHVGMLRAALPTSRVARECLGRLQQRAAGTRSRGARRRAMQALSEGGRLDLVGGLLEHSSSKVRHAAYRALARSGCEQSVLDQVLGYVAAERYEPAALAGLECVARADRNGSHTAALLDLAAGRGGGSPLLEDYFMAQLGERRRRMVRDAVTRSLEDWFSDLISVTENSELGRFRVAIGMCNEKQPLVDVGDDKFGFRVSSRFCNQFDHTQPYFGQASSTLVVQNSIEAEARLFGFPVQVMYAGIDFEVGTSFRSTDRSPPTAAAQIMRARSGDSPPRSGSHARGLLQAEGVCAKGRARDCCGQWSECEACSVHDPAWTLVLPTCPCMLNATCQTARWCSCDTDSGDTDCAAEAEAGRCFARLECTDSWHEDSDHLTRWRKADHGAAVCVVSSASRGGHVQRCCYDSAQQLITRGPAAGTPAMYHPGRDVARHLQWDFQAAVDCGLNTMLDSRYLERRPPSGQLCAENPLLVSTAPSLLERSFEQFTKQGVPEGESLGSCAMQDSTCKPFCLSGGLSARECDAAQFSLFVQFDGVHIAVSDSTGGSWVGKWGASSGDVEARPVDQYRVGGPIPEGKWWLTREGTDLVVEAFPCCGTQLLQRSACNSFSSTGAGPCESAFRLFSPETATGDHRGVLVHDGDATSLFALLDGQESILLVVDYATPLTSPALHVESNQWTLGAAGFSSKNGPVLSPAVQSKLNLMDGDACFGYEILKRLDLFDDKAEAGAKRCSHGPRQFKSCARDGDCRSCGKDGTCDAKEMQIVCIGREDASGMQQKDFEEHLAKMSFDDPVAEGEKEDQTYLQLCKDWHYGYHTGWFEISIVFHCGVGIMGRATVQGCVSPNLGVSASLAPGVSFVAKSKVDVPHT